MIELDHVSKVFSGRPVVRDVSFSVAKGEVVGFLGLNGAGKTTTMRLLAGCLVPTSGQVHLCGYNLLSQRLRAQRLVGYVPESAALWPDMTPRSVLTFVAEVHGLRGKAKEKALDMALDVVGLRSVVHQPVATLSKGYKRRVSLAQALLHRPSVLILDEPTDGLDPEQKHHTHALIRHMASEKAIVISTHLLEDVSTVCSRVVLIHHGQIVTDESPEALRARHEDHNALSLEAPGEQEHVASLLRTLPGVASVHVGDNGALCVRSRGPDLEASAHHLLRKHGVAYERMHPLQGNLEEVFRQLTQKEAS